MRKQLFPCVLALLLGILMLALAWLGATTPARADPNVHCVNLTGTGCAGDCGSCYASVQAAVGAALPGQEIRIAGGVYTGSLGTVAVITESLRLVGGYSPDLAVFDPITYQTALDAQWGGSVVVVTGTADVLLRHLMLTRGDGSGNECYSSDGCGGGIYAVTATVQMEHCAIVENVGSSSGSGAGGGVYIFHSIGSTATARIDDCLIANNAASTDGPGSGGGAFLHTPNAAAPAAILASHFELNTASAITQGLGGGVFLHYYATFGGNLFQGNAGSRGPGGPGSGGALYLWYAPGVILDRNRFLSNTASLSGDGVGGMMQAYSLVALTMTNNLVAHNAASRIGGGIYLDGWYAARGITALLIHNTLVDNDAGAAGEGIWVSRYVALDLINNLIAGHTVGVTNTHPESSLISAYANLFWNDADPIVGANSVRQDPLLWPDYHLDHASPAINRGVFTWVVTDFDGEPRPDWCFPDVGFDEFITGHGGCQHVYLPLVVRNT